MTSWEWPKWKNADEVTMVRMVKAQEDTLNDMWEEAGAPAFESWILLITSSDEESRLQSNMENLIWAFSVYTDEYGNELEHLVNKASFLWFISKPLRSLAASYWLTNLFYKANVFTTWELTSLFHFPDYTYNRSNAIEWMQYKVVAAPSNLPTLSNDSATDYIISGQLAEKYKWWNLSKVLEEDKNHWAVWKKTVTKDELVPIDKYKVSFLCIKKIITVQLVDVISSGICVTDILCMSQTIVDFVVDDADVHFWVIRFVFADIFKGIVDWTIIHN